MRQKRSQKEQNKKPPPPPLSLLPFSLNAILLHLQQFASSSYVVTEGAGVAMLTITRVGGSSGEVSVRVTTSSVSQTYATTLARGTDNSGDLEQVLPGVISISPNANEAQFTPYPSLDNSSKLVRRAAFEG